MSLSGVILSVMGSSLNMIMSPKLEKIVQRGLIKAAIKTGGWVSSIGLDTG